jgi:uncharacterized HAD superfamily protein
MAKTGKTYVIVDIDGTLADVRHRLHHINGPCNKDWKAFFEGMDQDKPVPEILCQVRDLREKHKILIVTGRPEYYRARTEAWLKRHGIQYVKLFMRRAGDHRPDYEAKSIVLDEIDPKDIVLAIDDRPPVCEMYERHGIKCQLIKSDKENQMVNEVYRKPEASRKLKNSGGG